MNLQLLWLTIVVIIGFMACIHFLRSIRDAIDKQQNRDS